MTDAAYPLLPTYPLPTQALRSPLPEAAPQQSAAPAVPVPDENALSEALTPLISAVIARRARQRRYTP